MSPAAEPVPPIRVLVVDAGRESAEALAALVASDARLAVAAVLGDGRAAVDYVAASRPDVVLMDLHLPRMDGFEATRAIMESHPLPIVVCTAAGDPADVATAMRSMEAGAVSCIRKPRPGAADFAADAGRLLETLRLMSEVKVVRRRPRGRPVAVRPASARGAIKVVGIGASTGGPPVLQAILGALPRDFPVPLLVVQHIADGFLAGLAEWLSQTTGLRVVVAAHGATPAPAQVYLAPNDFHMGYAGGRIVLSHEPPENGVRPSVSHLFRSLAASCGDQAVGVLLSGMGKDGAAELKRMRERGAPTIAQDRATSVVHGMPGEAIACGAASRVLPADAIAPALAALLAQRRTASYGDPAA